MSTRDRIPPHLRRFVVEQDPTAYDEIDHAVWRFVLLQMYHRGVESAHPAYAEGLAQTGISVDRIPSIAEMDACLSHFGWGAVAVDGFIPPRAFQELQACGILPIAVEIRRPEHLAYTPAPDIIHESAGHAPIIPDPEYSAFLRRFGEVGAQAFSSSQDQRLYEAIHALSELKEDASAQPGQVADAERALADLQKESGELSEAARLSRLHWWTVEYGLVGTPTDFKLYGAGLLSSLGESHLLHRDHVRKLPLSARCIELGYDITAPQPQLFVAESFAHLRDVLEEVAQGLAQARGGALALERALAARELSTLELSSGLQLIGVPEAIEGAAADPAYVRLAGPCALAHAGRLLPAHHRQAHGQGYSTPIGVLEDGTALERLRPSDLGRVGGAGSSSRLELRFRSGVRVAGELHSVETDAEGYLRVVSLLGARVTRGDRVLFHPSLGRYDLAAGRHVRRAFAGPADPAYYAETDFPSTRVPRAKLRDASGLGLLALFQRALELWSHPESDSLVPGFEALHEQLRGEAPDDWLLRWNLLESLRKLDRGHGLAERLRGELLEIESREPDTLPISTGLRYLDQRYPTRPRPDRA